jgi:hypothetical protein
MRTTDNKKRWLHLEKKGLFSTTRVNRQDFDGINRQLNRQLNLELNRERFK